MSRRKLLRQRCGSDAGTAPIEFIFASVVLMIPLVYLIIALGHLQAGSYAAQTTAINAARTAAHHPDSARARIDALADLHFTDFGVADADYSVAIRCSGDCAEAGSTVTASVRARVPVPGVPAIFGRRHIPHVTLTARHSDVVKPSRGQSDSDAEPRRPGGGSKAAEGSAAGGGAASGGSPDAEQAPEVAAP